MPTPNTRVKSPAAKVAKATGPAKAVAPAKAAAPTKDPAPAKLAAQAKAAPAGKGAPSARTAKASTRSAKPAEPVAALPHDLAIPKAFLAVALDTGVFLLGAIPEHASKMIALGYADPANGEMVLCCVPSNGGVLQIDTAAFAEPSQSGQQTPREQKFVAFLPVPAALLAQPNITMQFGAMQEDRVQTLFALDVKRMPAMDPGMRESVMHEYRHLFRQAITAMSPAKKVQAKAASGEMSAAAPAQAKPAASAATIPAPVGEATNRVRGFFETVSGGHAIGWAYDPSNATQRLIVEILEGNRVVARGVADQLRDDLLKAGIGDGHHCYKLPISYELRDGKPHNLTARVAGNKRPLQITGGGSSQLFEHVAVDTSEFDLIPSSDTLKLAAGILAGVKDVARQKILAETFSKANLALETRELAEARRGFLELAQVFRDQPLFFCKVGESYLLNRQHQYAADAYRKAIDRGPRFGWAWLGLGCAHRLPQAWPEAEAAYLKSAALMPGNPLAAKRLASVSMRAQKVKLQALLDAGKRDEAMAILKPRILEYSADKEGSALLEMVFCQPAQGDGLPEDKELQAFLVAQQLLDLVLDAAQALLEKRK